MLWHEQGDKLQLSPPPDRTAFAVPVWPEKPALTPSPGWEPHRAGRAPHHAYQQPVSPTTSLNPPRDPEAH